MAAATEESRVPGLLHFDVKFTQKNFESSAKTLIKHVKKKWDIEHLRSKTFEFGITNQLVGYYIDDGKTKITSQFGEYGRSEMILFRVYGNKTELIIDRAKELRNFQLLVDHGMAPPLYCTFENGYCYGFIEGDVLTRDDVGNVTMADYIAKLFAKLHSVVLPDDYLTHIKPENGLFETLLRYLSLAPKQFEDPVKQDRYVKNVPSLDQLKNEIEDIRSATEKYTPNNVLCHMDMLCANLIFNDKQDKMYMIDYEYACPGYAMYDIGNHFNEFAGEIGDHVRKLEVKKQSDAM